MASVLHHVHKRKRVYLVGEPYPHPNKFKRMMDWLIYFVAVLGPLVAIPQVLKIWIEQNASGVSIISWGAYLLGSIIWITYGLIHNEKPIIISNILWMIANIFIVIGIFVYG